MSLRISDVSTHLWFLALLLSSEPDGDASDVLDLPAEVVELLQVVSGNFDGNGRQGKSDGNVDDREGHIRFTKNFFFASEQMYKLYKVEQNKINN